MQHGENGVEITLVLVMKGYTTSLRERIGVNTMFCAFSLFKVCTVHKAWRIYLGSFNQTKIPTGYKQLHMGPL